jgi:hypothetical protein
MGGIDSATWQALGLVLTLLGLGASALVWRRRGAAKGLRGVAWSLLPLAAGLTGVLRLGWEITDSVVSWAGRLVFSPVVWLGLLVAVASVVLFVVSGWMLRRGAPPPSTRPTAPAQVAEPQAAALTATRGKAGGQGGATRPASAGDDMADIEEILRKHGIQ